MCDYYWIKITTMLYYPIDGLCRKEFYELYRKEPDAGEQYCQRELLK
jgi:hypothetical protein